MAPVGRGAGGRKQQQPAATTTTMASASGDGVGAGGGGGEGDVTQLEVMPKARFACPGKVSGCVRLEMHGWGKRPPSPKPRIVSLIN